MEISQLKALLAVAEVRNFTKAAETLDCALGGNFIQKTPNMPKGGGLCLK
ncbi:MAG: hypothetical protein ACOY46_15065 [Bacillota bacterium]